MWNILIQTASSYTSQKYFKQLIKDQWVAIGLKLYSKLQVNLQLCCGLYTSCTPFPRLWDGEKVMWNILIQADSSYTSQKYFKQLIKDQWVAMPIASGKGVQQVYKPQQSCKFTYNQLAYSHPLIFNQLFKIFLGGVRTSRLDQKVPHDFLSIPQPWERCTASVQATAELQIYL